MHSFNVELAGIGEPVQDLGTVGESVRLHDNQGGDSLRAVGSSLRDVGIQAEASQDQNQIRRPIAVPPGGLD